MKYCPLYYRVVVSTHTVVNNSCKKTAISNFQDYPVQLKMLYLFIQRHGLMIAFVPFT